MSQDAGRMLLPCRVGDSSRCLANFLDEFYRRPNAARSPVRRRCWLRSSVTRAACRMPTRRHR